jgi:hypothetical protein
MTIIFGLWDCSGMLYIGATLSHIKLAFDEAENNGVDNSVI